MQSCWDLHALLLLLVCCCVSVWHAGIEQALSLLSLATFSHNAASNSIIIVVAVLVAVAVVLLLVVVAAANNEYICNVNGMQQQQEQQTQQQQQEEQQHLAAAAILQLFLFALLQRCVALRCSALCRVALPCVVCLSFACFVIKMNPNLNTTRAPSGDR